MTLSSAWSALPVAKAASTPARALPASTGSSAPSSSSSSASSSGASPSSSSSPSSTRRSRCGIRSRLKGGQEGGGKTWFNGDARGITRRAVCNDFFRKLFPLTIFDREFLPMRWLPRPRALGTARCTSSVFTTRYVTQGCLWLQKFTYERVPWPHRVAEKSFIFPH
jgi:hypothetical protein